MFRVYVETYLGRPAKDVKDLSSLCLTVMLNDVYATQIGYNNKVFVERGGHTKEGGFVFANTLAATPGVKARKFVFSVLNTSYS